MNETFKNENIILVFIITLSHVNKMTKYWSFNHVEKNLLFYDSFHYFMWAQHMKLFYIYDIWKMFKNENQTLFLFLFLLLCNLDD